jgi:hypothetical protein
MNVVVFLQNAWSPLYAGKVWPRESWLRALVASRSGQRLKVLVDSFNECENTTPHVSSTPDGVCPPDTEHIQKILRERKPDVVIACGKQAERALLIIWRGPMVVVPHPACRVLTTRAYLLANQMLTDDFNDRVAIRQKRGGLAMEKL